MAEAALALQTVAAPLATLPAEPSPSGWRTERIFEQKGSDDRHRCRPTDPHNPSATTTEPKRFDWPLLHWGSRAHPEHSSRHNQLGTDTDPHLRSPRHSTNSPQQSDCIVDCIVARFGARRATRSNNATALSIFAG